MRKQSRNKSWRSSGLGVAALATGATLALAVAPGVPAASADVVTFQNQAPAPFGGGTYSGAESTWFLEAGPNQAARGQNSRLWARGDSSGDAYMSLVRWDLSSLAGKYSSIDSVAVELFVASTPGDGTASLHAVDSTNGNWTFTPGGSSSSTHAPTDGSSTWAWQNQFGYTDSNNVVQGDPTANIAWTGGAGLGNLTTQGGFGPALATLNVDGTFDSTYAHFTLSDPSIVDQWVNSAVNPGLAVVSLSNAADPGQIRFVSAGYDVGPRLIVTYTAVPEPATLALFGAGGLLMLSRRRRKAQA